MNKNFNKNYHYKNKVKKNNNNAKVKIIPLGGLDQIGMNITIIEDEDDIIVIDCGLAFPGDDLLGIDFVIPDIRYLIENKNKVRGFVITHGHEDHIGAIPYIIKDINVPIYGTKLTLALIERKLKEQNLEKIVSLNCVNFGDTIKLGNMQVEFIKTNHSIVDACALAIYTRAGILMHTGDFKVDYTPVFGDAIDLKRFAEIGSKGVLALMSDSTNATKTGFTMSEKTVGNTFDTIFSEYKNNRIIVATFASNVDRVRQIIDTAFRYDRKVDIEGRSMVNIINTAQELDYIDIPKGTLIESDELKNYPDEKTVIITTGSQGESMAALSRMALSNHKKIEIKPSDVVILSSTPIPGNEKAVNKVINELSKKHARVIYHDTHVSGHACQEEIKLIYTLVTPTYAIPLHGEYRHRIEAAHIIKEVGVKKENCIVLDNGDILEISNEKANIIGKAPSGGVLVDGLGVGDVGSIVLKDRQSLGNDGIIIVCLALEHKNSILVSGPEIISRGFVYMRESEALLSELKKEVIRVLNECQDKNINDWSKIKQNIKGTLSSLLKKRLKREPVIMPIILEI
ncbi:MAG: ribonuclease J [Eubacteriales bacterium]|nr:ribonuclease J [Eubacteriales bacterium]